MFKTRNFSEAELARFRALQRLSFSILKPPRKTSRRSTMAARRPNATAIHSPCRMT